MMRSLYSGISGLRNHQTRMDVIGNNIANVNTTGYKASRTIFQDVFSQTLSGGMANIGPVGGINPTQIGLGIRLSSVDVLHNFAPFQRTDKATDMMINGDGFFMVRNEDDTGYYYTRAGNFYVDNEGYLVSSHGFYVMGYGTPLEAYIVEPPYAGDPADPNDPPRPPVIGYRYIENAQPHYGQEGLSRIRLQVTGPDFSNFMELLMDEEYEDLELWDELFGDGGIFDGWEDMSDEERADAMADFDELVDDLIAQGLMERSPTSLVGFAVGQDGSISVMVNNRKMVVSTLAIAMFASPEGLDKAGNSLYRESAPSGPVEIGQAYYNGAGSVSGGGLEMSNVDLAAEFTDMIVTQRGFQANSRIITVSDTMLEELVNLKR